MIFEKERFREAADVRVDPGSITRRTSSGGRTIIEATLAPETLPNISWSSREGRPTSTQREARFLSDTKTLVTIGEGEIRVAALLDLTIVQGEPERFDVTLPPGFETVSVTGASLEAYAEQSGVLSLAVRERSRRRHQFLAVLERSTTSGSQQSQVTLPSLAASQRETGEVAAEGVGTLELIVPERGALRRMDASEASTALKSLAREPLLLAFRYHRRAGETVTLDLDIRRFPDAPVLAAVAERATATTLVTTEGRMLTEITPTMRNQGQPFLRVNLPEGATVLSAEVAGRV